MRVNWWPWYGRNDVIINNNYSGYTPNFTHCCGGGMNSLFGTMMKFNMINSFFNMAMNNIFPNKSQQQQQAVPPFACQYYPTMYPGLYFQNGMGGAGAAADGLGGAGMSGAYSLGGAAEQNNDYMIMQSLAKTNNLSIVGPSNDGEYYLKAKGKKPIKFGSFDDLKNYMEEKYTTTADAVEEESAKKEPDKTGQKPEEITVRAEDEETSETKPETVDGDGGDAGDAGDAGKTGDTGDTKKSLHKKKISVPENWSKVKDYININDIIKKRPNRKHAATFAAKKLLEYYNLNLDDYNLGKLTTDLAKFNPSVFDNGGNFAKNYDISKLDVPNVKALAVYHKTNVAQANNAMSIAEYNNSINIGGETKYGFVYPKGNKIYSSKSWEYADSDAIFVIGGKSYNLVSSGRTYDYSAIFGERTLFRNEGWIDPTTGRFKKNNKYTKYLKLEAIDNKKGKLNDCQIKTNKSGATVIIYNSKEYDMNDVMTGKYNNDFK